MEHLSRRTLGFALTLAFCAGFVPGWRGTTLAETADANAQSVADFDAMVALGGGSEYFACRADCAKQAHAGLRACLEAGGDRRACAEEAKAALEECVATACAGIQPPCRLGCAQGAQAAYQACVANGGERKACAQEARAALSACLDTCPPPPWMCRLKCHAQGAEAYRACRANGGERAACAEEARAVTQACIDANCAAPATP